MAVLPDTRWRLLTLACLSYEAPPPNVWTFRRDATTGVWLLDSLSLGLG